MLHSSRFNFTPGSGASGSNSDNVGMEAGILLGVNCFTTEAATEPVAVYVEIGLARSQNPIDRIAILSTGYVTVHSPVGWTGALQLDSDCFLYCTAYATGLAQEIQIGYCIDKAN